MREVISFTAGLYRAADLGLLCDLVRIEDDVYRGSIPDDISPVTVARIMAQWLPGQGFPLKGSGGMTWYRGKHHYGTLLNIAAVPNVFKAQGIVQGVLGEEYVPGWTVGNLARQLLKWVRPGQQDAGYTPDAERLLLGTPYGYHECDPGKRKEVTYYDVRSYYYDMANRVPSLNVYCGRRGLTWFDTEPSEWARWQKVISAVGHCKPLRNVLAGNMAGSMPNDPADQPVRVWYSSEDHKVKVGTIPHTWGRFRAVGLLFIRSGAELLMQTCHDAGNRAYYANVDGIHMSGSCPSIWNDHGFTVGVKATGFAETCHRGSYTVAGIGTKPYAAGEREYIPAARLPLPNVRYGSWLRV